METSSPRRRSRKRTLVIVFSLVFTLLIIAGCGRGGEAQFSPDTMQKRGVTVYSIPYADVELFRIASPPRSPILVDYWIDQGFLIPPSNSDSIRWDVITGWRAWERLSFGGRAKGFWYRCSCRSDDAMNEWIDWSKRHPDLANRLWPKVIELIQRGDSRGYALAGDLMYTVDESESAGEFEERFAFWEKLWAEEMP